MGYDTKTNPTPLKMRLLNSIKINVVANKDLEHIYSESTDIILTATDKDKKNAG